MPNLHLLKLKLGGAGDDARMRAVRAARPDARLVGDANEAWTVDLLGPLLEVAAECSFETIEQPLPANADGALGTRDRPVPICADESAHVDFTRFIAEVASVYTRVIIGHWLADPDRPVQAGVADR